MNQPKVSLILTTYNSAENLPTTLKSIEDQDYPNIEVVIKDGGSKDGTKEIIDAFCARHTATGRSETLSAQQIGAEQAADGNETENNSISVITASKPDTGIYDAMNQGIELCTGDIIACFNDTFSCRDAISKYVRALGEKVTESDVIDAEGPTSVPKTDRYDLVHSDLVYADGDRVVRTWKMGPGNGKDLKRGWMPGHPSLYIRREVYDKYGLYKTDYRIAADYEFMVRILKDNTLKINYIPESLISMYYGGTSSSSLASYIKSFNEGWRALRENHVPFGLWITIRRTVKVLLQF